jgi:tetratricopeptide (TPR) repeat protein
MTTTNCCAECGNEGGVSLKVCKSCMQVRYCNAECQRNHWPKHKAACNIRAAEIRDEALFKDPPSKEDCPICFLPMPASLTNCVSLPPATILSVPIYDFAVANAELADEDTEIYYPCCGKSVCEGCIHSFRESGNDEKCPFCNAEINKTDEEKVEEVIRRVEANDPASICILAGYYLRGLRGVEQDHAKAMELYTRAADLGFGKAYNKLAGVYHEGGNLKKAKFHFEAAAMAGHEVARCVVGYMEYESGNMERALKHWTIAASAGYHTAMYALRTGFEKGYVSRESIDSTLAAYNNFCAEMRSEARDACIRAKLESI